MADLRDFGPFEMAHGFEDPRKVEDEMFRIAALNAADANARLAAMTAQRDELLAELRNIADANPSGWDQEVRDQFRPWAQNRARAAIAKAESTRD